MTPLLVLDDARLAQSLADYLTSRGLACQLSQSETGTTLYLLDDRRLAEAEAEVERFVADPFHPRYAEASWRSGRPQPHLDYGAGRHPVSAHLLLQAGPVTLAVLVACVGVFLLGLVGLPLFGWLGFHQQLSDFTGPQVWRFVTPALLHFTGMHLIFNLTWWWYLGSRIERRYGSGKLLTLFLVASAVPNLLEFLLSGPDFGGLSGVVYGLLGYLWLRERRARRPGRAVSDGLFLFMLVWLVLGFFDLLGIQMANAAHSGGLAIGLLQAWLDGRKTRHQATGRGSW